MSKKKFARGHTSAIELFRGHTSAIELFRGMKIITNFHEDIQVKDSQIIELAIAIHYCEMIADMV